MMAAVAARGGDHRTTGATNESLRCWTGCNPPVEVDPLQQLRVVRSPATSRAEAAGGVPKACAPDSCMKLRPSVDIAQAYPAVMGSTAWSDGLDYPIRGGAEASTTGKNIAHFPPLRAATSSLDDDRFELLATKRGTGFGEDRPTLLSGPTMGDPTSSVVPSLASGNVLEPWSCSSSNGSGVIDPGAAGSSRWIRQGSQEDCRIVAGQQQLREEPESVSAPSQRLHEMKEYFLWQKRGARNGGHDLQQQQRHELVDDLACRPRPGMSEEPPREGVNAAGGGAGGGCVSDGAAGGGGAGGERGLWNDGIKPYSLPTATMTGVLADEATIVSNQSGDDGDRGNGSGNGRVWEVEPNGSGVCDDGGEFDPQAECRPGQPGQGTGGSPSSWWRDTPETVNTSFPWDLQLPNPAPPLALPHSHSLGLRGSTESTSVGLGPSPAFRISGHAPMCRCDACCAASGGGGGAARRRGSEHPGSLFGTGNGRGAVLDGAGFSESGGPVYGGVRWSANASNAAESCAPWGHEGTGGNGNGNEGGGGPGPNGDCGPYDVRRGGIPADDALAPRATPATGGVATSLGSVLPSVGFGPDRFASDLHSLPVSGGYKANTVCTERAAAAGALGGGGPRVKRSRMNNSGGGAIFHNELSSAGGDSADIKHQAKRQVQEQAQPAVVGATRQHVDPIEKPRTRDAKNANGKKAPASSRRCRAEGCQSHPNFGVEGDRRALYCAKHKLAGMINVKAPRCQDPECTRNPVYGHPGDPRATFCLKHKTPEMVDVKNRCCQHAGCKHQPSFGMAGDRRANFCFAHKLPSHVNIRRAKKRMG